MSPTVPSPNSLVTSREATCAGFLAQAKAKGQRTSPYVKEATRLWDTLQNAASVDDVIELVPLKTLATAVGFSIRRSATSPMTNSEKASALCLARLERRLTTIFVRRFYTGTY